MALTPVLGHREQIGYAFGMLGWSILINIVTVMLIYLYVPPSNAGLPVLVPQITVFGIISVLSLVVAGGRLLDAVTDPLIAFFSDRSKHPRGRRLPFMQVAILPAVIFGILLFIPLYYRETTGNLWWLFGIQAGFYLSLTVYIIPYNALLPELAPTPQEKVGLSAWLSFAFVLGMIISSQTPLIADYWQSGFPGTDRHSAFQWAIGMLCSLAGFFMAVPLLVIDERRHVRGEPTTVAITQALRQTLSNHNFLIFISADFAYFVSLTIISSGMLYYVRVLLGLPESIGGQVMGTMVMVSLLFYPLVIRIANQYGKRLPMAFSLLFLGIMLMVIYFFGRMPFSPRMQIFGFAILCSLPVAFLGILPYAIIADIADYDGRRTGQQKEGMFFAVRNFMVKMGQTLGIMVFAILTLFGKDPNHDWGIRLAGLFGGVLCIVAGLLFLRFRKPPSTRQSNAVEDPYER